MFPKYKKLFCLSKDLKGEKLIFCGKSFPILKCELIVMREMRASAPTRWEVRTLRSPPSVAVAELGTAATQFSGF